MKQDTYDKLDYACTLIQDQLESVRNETNEVVGTRDHVAIIKHFAKLRQMAEWVKESREVLYEIEDKLSKEQIPDVFKENGIKTTTIEGVGRVSVSNRFSASMLDKELAFNWLRQTGNEGIIIETVNSSTLAAFAKSKLEEDGTELPSDIFKVGTTPYTSITKVK